ncbi:MAG: glycosyltransferase family 4 protein [Thomasclavelia spiroformis]|uniref:glycosyltransferase family 4 protein n=1 Tax=Thomasclavelia spiroformis TaxID=29348 RepID=UPI00241D83EF|nr:glycosyltransferase family 4 protein [Thomasclavelia spiroformis]
MLYVTNIAAPYRVDFFNDLSKYCDLTVLFERKKAVDRNDEWYNNAFSFNGIFLKSKNIGNEAAISFEVIKYLKQKYDLIILGGYSSPTAIIASLYMKFSKIPYILNADGGFINYSERKINKFIKTFFISSAKYWLSSGKETNKYLVYYGANEKNIYNFPFTSLKESDILKEPISIEAKKKLKRNFNISYDKVILSIGQFIPRKGFDWMIEAYKDLDKSIGIYIIGGKPTNEYLKLKEKYKMDNLYFVDFQDKESVLNWYRSADLFVLPTREDIWGLVINEALSQGLPVITTNKCIAGLELIEDGKNGYIIDVENKEMLLEKTNFFFSLSNEKRKNIMENCLNKINKYTLENMSTIHADFLKKIENYKIDR